MQPPDTESPIPPAYQRPSRRRKDYNPDHPGDLGDSLREWRLDRLPPKSGEAPDQERRLAHGTAFEICALALRAYRASQVPQDRAYWADKLAWAVGTFSVQPTAQSLAYLQHFDQVTADLNEPALRFHLLLSYRAFKEHDFSAVMQTLDLDLDPRSIEASWREHTLLDELNPAESSFTPAQIRELALAVSTRAIPTVLKKNGKVITALIAQALKR